jgi:uncharacterized protein YkwD
MPIPLSRTAQRLCCFALLIALLAISQQAVAPAALAGQNSHQIALPLIMRTPNTITIASATELQAVQLTNQLRQQHGCPPLRISAELTAAARGHSQEMADYNYFSHIDRGGHHSDWRAHQAGYSALAGWENIGAGYATAADVINSWFNETPPNDGHRRNILNCALTDIGIGFAANPHSDYGNYWTQDFGQR